MKEEMIKEMEGEKKEEEENLMMIMKIVIIHERDQGTPGIKLMLLINLNIFLFLHYLVHLLRILVKIAWLIMGPPITSLDIRRFSLIWLRRRLI